MNPPAHPDGIYSAKGEQYAVSYNQYLHTLLIHGVRSLLANGKDLPEWTVRLQARKPFNVAGVALANRQARLVWALLTHDRDYQKDYISQPPAG